MTTAQIAPGMLPALPAWRVPIEAALDADPAEQRHRHLLADLLDEAGDPDGAALHYQAQHGFAPLSLYGGSRWAWHLGRNGWSGGHRLPLRLYSFLPLWSGGTAYTCRYYTRSEADRAFCEAFHKCLQHYGRLD